MASKITKIVANFETQLGATLSPSATTGSLKSPVIDDDGVTLPDGKYVMTVDIGNSKEEHLLFDLVGTTGAMSNIKSVSRQGAETTGAVRQHRSGAKVTLTNFANLLYVSNVLMGITPLDGASPLSYDIAPTLSNAPQLATKGYVDGVLTGSVGTATRDLSGTNKMTKSQGSKPRAVAVLVREQATPDKTLAVESFRQSFIDANINYAGGNTPNFIDPALGGDFAFALNPANGETITITVDGVATVVTFVTTIGVTAGNILIGGTVAVTRANFVNFINNPTVTNANQVAVTGTNLTAIQKLSATDDLATNAFVRVINPATTAFSVTETLAGAGNIWTVNSTKNRYDLVVVDSSNALQIRKGVEAVSPVVPTPTSGDCVLAVVFNKVGQTSVRETSTDAGATNGYIGQWYNPSIYRNDLAKTSDVSDVVLSLLAGENITAKDALAVSGTVQTTPITLDSKAGGNVGSGTTITYPLTVGNNTNRCLIVAVGTTAGTSSVTSVTYGGQAMTKIQDIAGTNNGRGVAGSISLWRLIAPPTGTNNVVVTQSSAVSAGSYAYSFYNVDQATPVDVSGGQTTNTSYSLTTTSLCDVLINFSTNFAGTGSPSSLSSLTFGGVNAVGLTDNSGYGLGAYGITAGYSPVAQTSGATTIAPSYADNSYMTASVGCALKPAQAPVDGVVKTNATSAQKVGFVGFAKSTVVAGNQVPIQVVGLVTGLTGLVTGTTYFLSNTAGQLSTTAGSNSKKVGIAISSTSLLIRNDNV